MYHANDLRVTCNGTCARLIDSNSSITQILPYFGGAFEYIVHLPKQHDSRCCLCPLDDYLFAVQYKLDAMRDALENLLCFILKAKPSKEFFEKLQNLAPTVACKIFIKMYKFE